MKIHCLTCLLLFAALFATAQPGSTIQYGNNPGAGSYFSVGDARIYYEVYGKGKPVVLLHGGLFGYIDEYESLIPVLSKTHQVIAIATRGHGKSELGTKPLSYQLFAQDTYAVIRHLTPDSVTVIGFSDGADQAYYLAIQHPETVRRLVAIAGDLGSATMSEGVKEALNRISAESLEKDMPDFVAGRKKLMPRPESFGKFIDALLKVWREPVYITEATFQTIACPTLLVAGERDGTPIERYVALYRLLKRAQLAIIPDSDHLVLFRKPKLMQEVILPFVH